MSFAMIFLSEGMWLEFSSHNQSPTFRWKFFSNEAPSEINSPTDKLAVLSKTHKAHFNISYVAGPTEKLLLLLYRTYYVQILSTLNLLDASLNFTSMTMLVTADLQTIFHT
jgi:hypothetical protein